jgi:glycosyltransferase involved in cell wall biosynthesis
VTDTSVVITCFNYADYLEEAVESALAQEPQPHVIVIDDGSTNPDTSEVLGRLPARVDVIRQENRGVSSARNEGLARATTPFLFVLDADDRLPPGALAALRAELDRHPAAGFAYGFARFFGDWEGMLAFPPYDPYRLLYRHIIGLSALMRREVVESTGGFDPSFDQYADWEFWLNALAHGWRGVQVQAVTLDYRRHRAAMSVGNRRKYRDQFARIRRKHRELYENRAALARESDLNPVGRAVYRYFWGARPIPVPLEQKLYALHWRRSSRD